MECLWVIADTPPVKVRNLLHSAFTTKTPLELVFEEDQRGKRLYFAVSLEGGAAQKGKWSDSTARSIRDLDVHRGPF
jgi:hypothetical protein